MPARSSAWARRPRVLAALAAVALVVGVSVLLTHLTRPTTTAVAKPVTAQPLPSLAGSTAEELMRALPGKGDFPSSWPVADRDAQNMNPLAVDPASCALRLLSHHGGLLSVERSAQAPDFQRNRYESRYATTRLALPKADEPALLDSAKTFLANCTAFHVIIAPQGSRLGPFPGYAAATAARVPHADESLGFKLVFAFAAGDPYANELTYVIVLRVRGVDVYISAGTSELAAELAEKTAERLTNL